MLYRARNVAVALTVVLAVVSVSSAGVEAWGESSSGASDHTAYMVLDYNGTDAYLLGYRWNDGDTLTRPDDGSQAYQDYVNGYSGGHTGYGDEAPANMSEGMMYAMMNVPSLSLTYSWHKDYGLFLSNINYDGLSFDVTTFNNPWSATMVMMWSGNAAYNDWQGSHPAQAPGSWEQSPMGVSTRELESGFWDGWVQGQFNTSTWVTEAPVPVIDPVPSSVPEPTTMGLLVMGGIGLLARKRR